MTGWISVKDKLPENDSTYLTLNENGWGVNIVDGKGMMLRVFYSKKQIFSSVFGHKYVTHWMPLPEPPKDE